MQLLITAAGNSDVFFSSGFESPKNLIEVSGEKIIDRVLRNYSNYLPAITVIVQESEVQKFDTDKYLSSSYKKLRVEVIKNQSKGALCSALMALDPTMMDRELVVVPGDSFTDIDIQIAIDYLRNKNATAGTIVFPSKSPRWSYVRLLEDGRITEVAEKRVISDWATTGFFYFKQAAGFFEGAKWALMNQAGHNGQYFISHSLQRLLAQQEPVFAYQLKTEESYHNFSTPADLLKGQINCK
jgi:NDP-sugar pyrophosphorylase family protein